MCFGRGSMTLIFDLNNNANLVRNSNDLYSDYLSNKNKQTKFCRLQEDEYTENPKKEG